MPRPAGGGDSVGTGHLVRSIRYSAARVHAFLSPAAIPASALTKAMRSADMPPFAEQSGPDFERHWTLWKERGVANEHKARQQFAVAAGVVAAIVFIGVAARSRTSL